MGMREDRESFACGELEYCEHMFLESRNPFYVIRAMSAAQRGKFTPPQWALTELLKAADLAYSDYLKSGGRVSIDAALGLKVSRGKAQRAREAHKYEIESQIFDLIRVVQVCFDISIPDACELVYYTIDCDFAEGCEALLSKRDDPLELPAGLTREEWRRMGTQEREELNARIERMDEPTTVKEKMRAGNWWAITRGDRLGYSLDQLLDRHYRHGTRRNPRWGKNVPGKTAFFCAGHLLLLMPANCTRKVIFTAGGSHPYQGTVSALTGLPKRPDFAQFDAQMHGTVTATVLKERISTQ